MARLHYSKRAASKRYWDADGEDPESPTSIDVLFQWLEAPGNYQRWQTARKQTVCEEIVADMERHGITHRAPKHVWMKMIKLENSFETATNWLVANGHYADFRRGNATGEVRKQLRKQCWYYDELAPILTRGVPADIAPSESSNETVSDAGQHDPPQEQVTTGEVNDNSTITDSAGGLYSQSPHLSVVQGNVVRPHGGAPVDTKLKVEDYSRSLRKLELESKKAQLRADVVCSTALNRKKMLDAGIDLKEVNRILPQPCQRLHPTFSMKQIHLNRRKIRPFEVSTQETPQSLFEAARRGDIHHACAMLEAGANVNAKGEDGNTALMEAAAWGRTEIVEYLVGTCAGDVNSTNGDGVTALMKAAAGGHTDVARYLAKVCGADVNATTMFGDSAATLAAQYGHTDLTQYLVVECKAVVNTTSRTTLRAAIDRHDDVVSRSRWR